MKRLLKCFCLLAVVTAFTVGCGESAKISAKNEEFESLKIEISEKEKQLEEQEGTLEYVQTEAWLEEAYEKLAKLEGKK